MATDSAGNQEAAPETADATTTVSVTNIAPTLAVIPDQQVIEGDTLVVDLTANDPDGSNNSLRFAFTSAVPPGVTINTVTGRISWVTGEADGGRTVPVTVRVTDAGVPPLSATRSFIITVLEDNKAPVLESVASQRASVGNILTVQLHASDADLPVQILNYHFTTPQPAGMTLNTTTGLISWTPTESQANLTAAVSVGVTDSGSPPREATMMFAVTVDPLFQDRPPQFYLTPAQLWLTGAVHTLAVNAFDPDGDAVTLTLNPAGLPGSLNFASTAGTGSGLITWNTSGVTPGLYSLPVQATAGGLSTVYSPQVKIVADNLYWRWALDHFTNAEDADPLADPDGDGTANIFEWEFFRDPLMPDSTLMNSTLETYEGGWRAMILDFYRRRGSNQFVTLTPQSSGDLGAWLDIPSPDFEVLLDPYGDRDEDPESEEVVFRIWMNPSNPAVKEFFRIKSATRPTLP